MIRSNLTCHFLFHICFTLQYEMSSFIKWKFVFVKCIVKFIKISDILKSENAVQNRIFANGRPKHEDDLWIFRNSLKLN